MDITARNIKVTAGDDPSLPLYERIRRYILKGIGSGAWPDGARIPSEHELVDLFSVSRMTVNRVMRELTAEGILIRVQGVGTFASRPTKAHSTLLKTQDISEEIKLRGHRHSCQVLTLQKQKAPPRLPNDWSFRPIAPSFIPSSCIARMTSRFSWKSGSSTRSSRRSISSRTSRRPRPIAIWSIAPRSRKSSTSFTRSYRMSASARCSRSDANDPCLLLLRRTWSGRTSQPTAASSIPATVMRSAVASRPSTMEKRQATILRRI